MNLPASGFAATVPASAADTSSFPVKGAATLFPSSRAVKGAATLLEAASAAVPKAIARLSEKVE